MAYPQFLSKSLMLRFCLIVFAANIFIQTFLVPESFAWIIFHKPEYKGKVIDTETEEPIEGVVAVAVYYTRDIIGGPGGQNNYEKHCKEAQTDKDGIFCISSYMALMGPNSQADDTEFIFYKPGYRVYWGANIPDYMKVGPDKYFTEEIGKQGETFGGTIEDISPEGRRRSRNKVVSITYGIVKLQLLNTREERHSSIPGRPTYSTPKDLPLLNAMIKKELEWLRKNEGWRR